MLLLLALLSLATAKKPKVPAPFPSVYGANITYYSQPANETTYQYAFVDAIDNQIRFDSETEPTGFFHEYLNTFNNGRQYSLFSNGARDIYCSWANETGQVFNTIFYPNISTGVLSQTNVDVHGVLCNCFTGSLCLADVYFETPFCGPFQYYETVNDATPKMLELIFASTVRYSVLFDDFTTNISMSDFLLPTSVNTSCGPSSGCTNCTLPKVVDLKGIPICNIALLPAWILAVLVGLSGAFFIARLGKNVTGSLCYAISLGTYAFMISSGFVTHSVFLVECGMGYISNGYISWSLIDSSLTSCIAVSFLFDALIDVKLIPERNKYTLLAMLVAYVAIFVAYFHNLVSTFILYFGLTAICCGLFLVFQIYRARTNKSWKGYLLLAFAGVSGAAGFLAIYFTCAVCQYVGTWAPEALWYYLADVAMFFIACFVLASRTPATPVTTPSEKKLLQIQQQGKQIKQSADVVIKV